MVEKFLVDGSHDKYESRVVAHGNEQDSTTYADWSPPTVAIQPLMTCLAVAVYNSDCVLGKLDPNRDAEMTVIPAYVQCKEKLKELVV